MLVLNLTLLKKYEDPKTYCTKVRLCYARKGHICKVNNIDLIGPWGLPLIGYIPFGLKQFENKLNELQKKYHPVFSWRIGSQLFVFICDFKLIKEAFQSQTFADRPNVSFINLFGEQDLGVLVSNGIHWHNIRKFTLRHLRDLGMGKSKIVSSST
ncbi:cytochrome P450 2L1 [Armadillidium vulgare]|nr:cytochrome P450 2L1 [Armadillidium vulgare]